MLSLGGVLHAELLHALAPIDSAVALSD